MRDGQPAGLLGGHTFQTLVQGATSALPSVELGRVQEMGEVSTKAKVYLVCG